MDKKLIYRNVLNHYGLGFQETKRINQLRLNNTPDEAINEMIFKENILQLPSHDLRARVKRETIFRLEEIGQPAQILIAEEDVQSAKSMVFYSLLVVDLLFREFARAIYLEKLLTFYNVLTKKEVTNFIEKQIERDEKAAKWTRPTIRKLAGTYLRILTEVGALQLTTKDTYEIRRLVISSRTHKYLKNDGFKPAAEVVLGELL